MRKLIIHILSLLIFGTPCIHGQLIDSYGLKGGVSFTNQSIRFTPIDYRMESDPIAGPSIILFIEGFKRQYQSIRLDLGYINKGFSSVVQSITVNHQVNDRLEVNEGDRYQSDFHYLSFSPLGRFFIEKDLISIYGILGPRLDILLKYITDSDYPLEDQNRLILGIDFGAGLEFELNKISLLTEIRYQPDITKVENREPMLIKNNGIIFLLGIKMNRSH